jgi:hypothetical protein
MKPSNMEPSSAHVDQQWRQHRKKVVGGVDRQVTTAPHGHVLTNAHVWSPDSKWLTFDTRSDAGGAKFDGGSIAAVHVSSEAVRTVYTAVKDAKCGVAMFRPRGFEPSLEHKREVVFIHGGAVQVESS